MTIGTKVYKNGNRVGYLHFDSGKKVYLNKAELQDLATRLRFIQFEAIEYGKPKVL